MKKIAFSFVSIAAVVGLAIGATSAYFTSAKSTEMNTFAAGTLNVDATVDGAYNVDPVNIGHLAPGEITGEKKFIIKNTGDIDTATFAKFTVTDDNDDLAAALNIYDYKVSYFKADNTPANRWSENGGYFGTTINQDYFIKDGDVSKWTAVGGATNLANWAYGNGPLDIPGTAWDEEWLPAGAYYVVSVRFQMNPDAGNEYMGKTVKVGYEVRATQLNDAAITALGFPGRFSALNTNANMYKLN